MQQDPLIVESSHLAVSASGPARPERIGGGSPSLVLYGQESTFKSLKYKSQWDRQQRRVYRTLQSWSLMKASEGFQLFRVDFTTGIDGDADLLAKHIAEIIRRVKREYGYDVEKFVVRTAEGYGVLHCIWAIKNDRAAYIHQAWLSLQWENIHGAHRVWIKRISGKSHLKNAVRYLVNQYLAGQTSIIRCSYSWNKCKIALGQGWASFRRLINERRPVMYHEERYGRDFAVRDWLPMGDIIRGWQALIEVGWCLVDGVVYVVDGRSVQPKYSTSAVFADACPF